MTLPLPIPAAQTRAAVQAHFDEGEAFYDQELWDAALAAYRAAVCFLVATAFCVKFVAHFWPALSLSDASIWLFLAAILAYLCYYYIRLILATVVVFLVYCSLPQQFDFASYMAWLIGWSILAFKSLACVVMCAYVYLGLATACEVRGARETASPPFVLRKNASFSLGRASARSLTYALRA